MNAFKLKKLNITIPMYWSNEGEGLMILESRKEEIVEALDNAFPNRCPHCDGRAVHTHFNCNAECSPEDESADGLYVNPLNLTERVTAEEREEMCPANSDAELPQELQDLLMINELITSEEMRIYCMENRICQRTGRPYWNS